MVVPLVWIICGVAGSGKSTLAKRLAAKAGLAFLDADQFHPSANIEKMSQGLPLDEADREPWLSGMEAALRQAKPPGLVLAFPGLRAQHRVRLLKGAPGARLAMLRVSRDTAHRRLTERGSFFPPSLIDSQFAILELTEDLVQVDAELSLDALEAQALAWLLPDPRPAAEGHSGP